MSEWLKEHAWKTNRPSDAESYRDTLSRITQRLSSQKTSRGAAGSISVFVADFRAILHSSYTVSAFTCFRRQDAREPPHLHGFVCCLVDPFDRHLQGGRATYALCRAMRAPCRTAVDKASPGPSGWLGGVAPQAGFEPTFAHRLQRASPATLRLTDRPRSAILWVLQCLSSVFGGGLFREC